MSNHVSQHGLDEILIGSHTSDSGRESRAGQLDLVCWNIQRGVRYAEIIKAFDGPLEADLYVLQEVDLHTSRTGYRNVAEEITRALGMNHIFGIEFEELAQHRDGCPAYSGQAVISRLPILQGRVLRFRNQLYDWGPWWKPCWSWLQPRRGGRMALVAEIQWNGKPCVIYNAHLESKATDANKKAQMQEILNDLHSHYARDIPMIVAGDFNTREGVHSQVLDGLRAEGFQDVHQDLDGSLQTKVGSNKRLDWIFVRNLCFSHSAVPNLIASDHYPLRVRLFEPLLTASACPTEVREVGRRE